MSAYPTCDVRNRNEYTGFYWLIQSEDPKLAAIQAFIASWQRTGAREGTVPLVLDDIARVLDGSAQTRSYESP